MDEYFCVKKNYPFFECKRRLPSYLKSKVLLKTTLSFRIVALRLFFYFSDRPHTEDGNTQPNYHNQGNVL